MNSCQKIYLQLLILELIFKNEIIVFNCISRTKLHFNVFKRKLLIKNMSLYFIFENKFKNMIFSTKTWKSSAKMNWFLTSPVFRLKLEFTNLFVVWYFYFWIEVQIFQLIEPKLSVVSEKKKMHQRQSFGTANESPRGLESHIFISCPEVSLTGERGEYNQKRVTRMDCQWSFTGHSTPHTWSKFGCVFCQTFNTCRV